MTIGAGRAVYDAAVDLREAERIMNSRARLHGRSDMALLDRVAKAPAFSGSGKPLTPAAGLTSGIILRPVEALHELAYITRPRYQDDVYDAYMQWGQLRYLGYFDHIPQAGTIPALGISAAGQRIAGNQRRVTSEDLGIGFGALLARKWFTASADSRVSVRIVDVDVALDDRVVYAGGVPLAVKKTRYNRPDYILIADDPANPGRYRIRILECKGSCHSSTAMTQMAQGIRQLGGLTIGGRVPAGLVTGIMANTKISYAAIDPDDDEGEPSFRVNSQTMERASGFLLRELRNVPGPIMASASLRASWSALADFGGNRDALTRWAPAAMRRRAADRQAYPRTEFGTRYGTARGTAFTFNLGEQRLTVRYGIAEAVDRVLGRGEVEAITEAQAGFALSLESADDAAGDDATPLTEQQSTGEVSSATPDGSLFSLHVDALRLPEPSTALGGSTGLEPVAGVEGLLDLGNGAARGCRRDPGRAYSQAIKIFSRDHTDGSTAPHRPSQSTDRATRRQPACPSSAHRASPEPVNDLSTV
jgi:hypothetical protein